MPKLILCPICHKRISSDAQLCPRCNCDIRSYMEKNQEYLKLASEQERMYWESLEKIKPGIEKEWKEEQRIQSAKYTKSTNEFIIKLLIAALLMVVLPLILLNLLADNITHLDLFIIICIELGSLLYAIILLIKAVIKGIKKFTKYKKYPTPDDVRSKLK